MQRDSCVKIRHCVEQCLSGRERRSSYCGYGLNGAPAQTQRKLPQGAAYQGPYVSRI